MTSLVGAVETPTNLDAPSASITTSSNVAANNGEISLNAPPVVNTAPVENTNPAPQVSVPAPILTTSSEAAVVVVQVEATGGAAAGAAVAPAGSGTTAPPPTKPTKSKKKKSSSHGASASQSGDGENTGRWTAEEHRLFLQGLEQHGKGWKKIASLIKSRTVVQIRTHAQKYFQKLAKARQNGEEGDVTMEGRGCAASVTSSASNIVIPTSKRRRQVMGTKRKAIQSVVVSAQRQGKKLAAQEAATTGVPNPIPPLPAVAPALAHFILPTELNNDADVISGSVLEDALYRFLTPMPPNTTIDGRVNEVAKQAGANPITVPSDNQNNGISTVGGDISPTGVADIFTYPAWIDAKDPPAWFTKGEDVDILLDVAETLDWLTDTGDLNEAFHAPIDEPMQITVTATTTETTTYHPAEEEAIPKPQNINSTSVTTLPRVDSNVDSIVPSLPDLFDGVHESTSSFQHLTKSVISSSNVLMPSQSVASMGTNLQVFDSAMEDHDFVSTILESSRDDADALSSLL